MRGRKKKADQVLTDEFKNAVGSAQDEELRTKVMTLCKAEEEAIEARANDHALTEAKDKVKEFSAPYSETLKGIKIRRRYILKVLKERGK